MNLALFRHSLRGHVKLGIVFLAVMSLYGGMITAMFDPKLGESLEMMAESMPQLFAAFGMLDAGKTLTQFLSNYLYGFLYIVFPMVLIVIAATRLVARWVDTGAAAYLLAAPAGRAKIAATQALALAAVPVVYVCLCLLCADGAGDVSRPIGRGCLSAPERRAFMPSNGLCGRVLSGQLRLP